MKYPARLLATGAILTSLLMVGVPTLIDAQGPPTFTAKLVDPEKKAANKEATVEVTTNLKLTDPATVAEKPAAGEGHLHYQVDTGPVIATPAAKLSFHELTPGPHTFVVTLVGNDHKPLAPPQKLAVTVPKT